MSWFIFIAGQGSNALNGHNFRPSVTAANIKQRDFVFRIVLSLFTHLVGITRFRARDRNETEDFHEISRRFLERMGKISSERSFVEVKFYAIIVARSLI